SAATTSTPPVRLACIVQPNGVYPAAWDVTGTGRDFQLSTILSPLEALKGDVTVLTNLDNVGAQGHVQMTGAFLTGVPMKNQRSGVPLDQMVAQKIGAGTPLPSIVLGTEPPRQGLANGEPISFANTVSWSSPTTRISPEINPRVAFDRMFRDQNSPEARRAAAGQRSVVDLGLEDARALPGRASGHARPTIAE